MDSLKLTLYIIGGLGVAFSVYGIFNGAETINIITGLVCGSSLIIGAQYTRKAESETKGK